ncbi:polyamine aminopropyltransferase [Marinicella rhabdoformis]|uniref:polyamine aminopropyltransferase n=1 Tax=Marinicella rhabdoformis TaxID=2580566 RepID=UPI0012AEC7AE|nr:polyamine aminopropyltransferase [Marinicella rhabdoformis]
MNGSYLERLYPSWGQQFKVEEVLFEHRTDHQHLVIFNNQQWGTVMALDGIIQTTEKDEFIYHEMMTHVPMLAHGSAKNVLIIGGGDGGILREVLKHKSVEQVIQVEIDQAVIDMCIEFLPGHSQGAFDDPRVEVVIDDGVHFVNQTEVQFDVIISDSTDPIGPGEVLFTSSFYQGVNRCLNQGGVFVAQNGVSFMQLDEVTTSYQRLSSEFKQAAFYTAAVPTYVGGIMAFAWATNNLALKSVDSSVLQQRVCDLNCHYYNPDIHVAAFALPAYINQAIKGVA